MLRTCACVASIVLMVPSFTGCRASGKHGTVLPPSRQTDTIPAEVVTMSDTEVELARGPENATAMRLGNLVLHVNRYGQTTGSLPQDLTPVIGTSSRNALLSTDLWGRPARYTRVGVTFELRSAGEDGEFNSPDDVWVTGQFGRDVACTMQIKDRRIDFPEFEPPCSP